MVTIADDLAANFERVRAAHGWTWEQMAEQFERDRDAARAAASPMHPFSDGFGILAAWARQRGQDEPPADPRPDPEPTPAQVPPKRNTRQKPPPRTA